MPKISRRFECGFVDVLSLISVVFLIASLVTATAAVSQRNANLDIRNRAMSTDGGLSTSTTPPKETSTSTTTVTPPKVTTSNTVSPAKEDIIAPNKKTSSTAKQIVTVPLTTVEQRTEKKSCIADGGTWSNNSCQYPKIAVSNTGPVPTPTKENTTSSTSKSCNEDALACLNNSDCQSGSKCSINYSTCRARCVTKSGTKSTAKQIVTVPLTTVEQRTEKKSCIADGGTWSNNSCQYPKIAVSNTGPVPTPTKENTTSSTGCNKDSLTCLSNSDCPAGNKCSVNYTTCQARCISSGSAATPVPTQTTTPQIPEVCPASANSECFGNGDCPANYTCRVTSNDCYNTCIPKPVIPTPTPVPAVAQNLKHYGDVCVNNNECESGTCDAGGGSRNIGAKKSCTAATVAENVTSIAMATGPFVVAFGGIAAAPVIAEALTGIAATNAAGGTGLATLPLATYSYATAAITASPALQTTIAVATLSQLPASIYACQIYGSDSPQCQYTAMGITSSYFSDVIGTEQALQGSAQVVKQNIVQPVVTAAKNYVNTITDPIGDTSNFRLTNAPSMQGQMLDNSLIEDFYGTAGTANSQGSQLAKYITGLDYTDPNLPDLLINDINIIRAKYNLPPRDMAFEDPYEYQRQLTALVQQKAGTTIIPEGDRLAFFESNPEAGGVFNSNDNAILTKYPRYDLYPENPQGALNTQGTVLTHEVVHALQNKYYSGMPIERMEYEAYLATISQNWLKKASPAEIVNMLFDYKINGSVSWWYKDQGLIPSWVNP